MTLPAPPAPTRDEALLTGLPLVVRQIPLSFSTVEWQLCLGGEVVRRLHRPADGATRHAVIELLS